MFQDIQSKTFLVAGGKNKVLCVNVCLKVYLNVDDVYIQTVNAATAMENSMQTLNITVYNAYK